MTSLIKQNTWTMGEIDPQNTELVNNKLYFSSALDLQNVYISKTQLLKRLPTTQKITLSESQLNLKKFFL